MAGQFGVTLDELRRVSRDLHDVSSAMRGVMSSLHAQLAAAGPAWGGGEMGHQFADGANGYLAQLDWADGSVEAKTGLLDYYSDLLKQVADSFEQSDDPGVSSPVVTNGAGSPGTGAAPFSPSGMTRPTSAGAIPGIGSDVARAGGVGATNEVGVPAGVGTPANGGASPTGAGGPGGGGGGRGGGAPSGAGEPETPSSQGRTPSQSDAAPESPGSGGATPEAPVSGDSPGDRVTAGVDAEDDASMRAGASTPEEMPDSSITSSDAGPFTDGAGSAPPNLPSLPKPPNKPNQRRADAPDAAPPPSPPTERRSRRPSGAPQADSGTQYRLGSVTGRAGVADKNGIRGEGVARARRRRSDPAQRSGITGDPSADGFAVGLAAGNPDQDSDDDRDSHPGDERGLGEESLRQDDPDRDR